MEEKGINFYPYRFIQTKPGHLKVRALRLFYLLLVNSYLLIVFQS